MGIKKWLAKKGNIGGTAKAVAKAWVKMKKADPQLDDTGIAEEYIRFRYGITREPHLIVQALQTLEDYSPTPSGLTWTILMTETAPQDVSVMIENMQMFSEIIDEVMDEYGL